MEQTTLQRIIEQKADQIRIAIEDAIENGAKIATKTFFCATIDGVFLQKDANRCFAVVLHFKSDKIEKVFEPSNDDLEKLAEQKRAELADIENQIKERAKE